MNSRICFPTGNLRMEPSQTDPDLCSPLVSPDLQIFAKFLAEVDPLGSTSRIWEKSGCTKGLRGISAPED